jgi:peptidoglycan-N-acetylglucosamine deacetylase
MLILLIICCLFAALATAAFYGAPWILRQFETSAMRSTIARKRMLALTYDDGPSIELTPMLLDLLHRRNARATFFLQGRNASRHPEIVDRIVREGHTVGCHSHQHLNAWKTSPAAAVADIDAGYNSLSRWIGSTAFFRPPYGKMTLATWWWTRRRRVPVSWWTLDSGDTHKVLPNTAQVAAAVRKNGGDVVLMHDINRTQNRNDFVLQLTSALLDVAESESLQILPLTELCP